MNRVEEELSQLLRHRQNYRVWALLGAHAQEVWALLGAHSENMNAKRFQTYFEIIALAAIAAFLVLLLNELRLLARDVRSDVNQASAELRTTIGTINAAAGQARQASSQANIAATAAAGAAAEQRAYWAKTSLETYKTMASLRLTIVRTDHSLNDEISPRLAKSLDATTDLQRVAAQDLDSSTARVNHTIDLLADPIANWTDASAKLPPIVDDFAASSSSLKTAASETAATMVSVHKGVDYEVSLLMKPVSKVRTGILIGASAIGNVLHGLL